MVGRRNSVHPGPSSTGLEMGSLRTNVRRPLSTSPAGRPLHEIARDGKVDEMRKRLESLIERKMRKQKEIKNANSNFLKDILSKKDESNYTPLHYAASYCRLQMCIHLVENGADVEAKGADDLTPLHAIAKSTRSRNNEDYKLVLGHLLESPDKKKKVDVNVRDKSGFTPLHHACMSGNETIVKQLLRLQSNRITIDAKDKGEMTPLHNAVIYGHANIIKLLKDAGASTKSLDDEKRTPLHLASMETNLQIVKILLSDNDDQRRQELKRKDIYGNTPLHLSVERGNFEITEYLIDQCIELETSELLNDKRFNNQTPVHLAASNSDEKILTSLLEKGADKNVIDESHTTPLMLACKFNKEHAVQILLDKGANAKLRDKNQFTALNIAARNGHSDIVRLLTERGVEICEDEENMTNVFHQCAEGDHLEAMQVLFQNDNTNLANSADHHGNTPLHIASLKGHYKIVDALLEHINIYSVKNHDGMTPLHLAAKNGQVEIISKLVEKDKAMIYRADVDGNTALHLAAMSGLVETVEKLVQLGANTEARNVKQWTAIFCCAYKGFSKSANVLLKGKCEVDPTDKGGKTPLHVACEEGHAEMVKLLLKRGADASKRSAGSDASGKHVTKLNPLDLAANNGHSDCAMAIIQSSQWKKALKNVTTDPDGKSRTPMRRLIKKLPEVAKVVFGKCVTTENEVRDTNYKVKFNYMFIDDEKTREGEEWKQPESSESSSGTEGTKSFFQRMMVCFSSFGAIEVNIFKIYFSSIVFKDRQADDNNDSVNKSDPIDIEPCLAIMVKYERQELLTHPLVISLLNYKWKKYGRIIYYSILLLYLLFLSFLNSYMITTPAPYIIDVNASVNSSCVEVFEELSTYWGTSCPLQHTYWQPAAKWLVLIFAAINTLKEFLQMFLLKAKYFTILTNYLELILYLSSVLLVVDFQTPNEDFSNLGIRQEWQWKLGVVAVFLSWIGLLLLIQNLPRFGLYVLMFNDILHTFLSFFVVFIFFILAFAFSFHALFQNQYQFEFWWNSIIKTLGMMIGEFEYSSLFYSEKNTDDITEQVYYEYLSYVLFVIFVFLVSIIIMNLLVGLAVDDIKGIQGTAELKRFILQANITMDTEDKLWTKLRRECLTKHHTLSPNAHNNKNLIMRWFLQDKYLSADDINKALTVEKTRIDHVITRVQKIRRKMQEINARTKEIESMVRTVLNQRDINSNRETVEDDEN